MKQSQEVQHVQESKSVSVNSDSKGNQSAIQFRHPMQLMANSSQRIVQLRSMQQLADQTTVQRQVNNTGLPDNLKSGIENLSGYSMNDVKVHYNSDKPAQLNAHAYAQGTNIHLASGQEKHLPHEAWHVVQQKQGRVQPTRQLKGKVAINDDAGLEQEADVMGEKALQLKVKEFDVPNDLLSPLNCGNDAPVQRYALVAGPSIQGRVGNLNFDTAVAGDVVALRAWVEEAAINNYPSLIRLAEQVLLNADAIDQDDRALVDFILQRTDRAKAEIEVEGAQMIYSDNNFAALTAADTVVMRAINTGDMYHIRAVLATAPRLRLLIWGVNPASRSQARMVASLINNPNIVYATDKGNQPAGFNQSETWATAEIERYLTAAIIQNVPEILANDALKGLLQATMNANMLGVGPYNLNTMTLVEVRTALGVLSAGSAGDGNHSFERAKSILRESRQAILAQNFAPYTDEEAGEFLTDLETRGNMNMNDRYILVNFRATGHSNRPGANAPALDTGTMGVRQITSIIEGVFGNNVIPVPMGEEPAELANGPNLLNYWTWPSMQGSRLKQASILRFLNENFNIIGAVGMRSGVIDQMVFAGIKVLSLDIGPNKGLADQHLPDLATSKGWDRGLKLENAYHEKYGRAFIDHERTDEETRNVPAWEGEFHDNDVATISNAIGFYFNNGGATATNFRHTSHPFNPNKVNQSFTQLRGYLQGHNVSPYDLVNNLAPYLRHLYSHRNSMPTKIAAITAAKNILEAKILEIEGGRAKTISWMQQHIRTALINQNLLYEHYAVQLAWVHQQFAGLDPNASLQAYRALHTVYLTGFNFDELWALLEEIVNGLNGF
jgi:hypothetical protein